MITAGMARVKAFRPRRDYILTFKRPTISLSRRRRFPLARSLPTVNRWAALSRHIWPARTRWGAYSRQHLHQFEGHGTSALPTLGRAGAVAVRHTHRYRDGQGSLYWCCTARTTRSSRTRKGGGSSKRSKAPSSSSSCAAITTMASSRASKTTFKGLSSFLNAHFAPPKRL